MKTCSPATIPMLELDGDICLEGDPEFADPELRFRQVHVVPGNGVVDLIASMIGSARGEPR